MSHTTKINGLNINDPALIRKAVEALQEQGVKVTLLENAKPKMYYDRQTADIGMCEFVLSLEGVKYEVGFKWNTEKNDYDVFYDPWLNRIGQHLGLPIPQNYDASEWTAGERSTCSNIGKFMNEYNMALFKQNAVEQGYMGDIETTTNEQGQRVLAIEMGGAM